MKNSNAADLHVGGAAAGERHGSLSSSSSGMGGQVVASAASAALAPVSPTDYGSSGQPRRPHLHSVAESTDSTEGTPLLLPVLPGRMARRQPTVDARPSDDSGELDLGDRAALLEECSSPTLSQYTSASSLAAGRKAQVSNTLKLLFFICGLSTFARSESVLMQTQMYAKCFNLGAQFYPAATSALFMPGIIIQLIQNRYDKIFDRKFTTYRAAHARLLLSVFASLAAMAMLLIAAYHDESIRSNAVFVYSDLAIMGIGISITFGSFVQLVSMFPHALHPFYFMGTYAPFFIFAPVNVGIKDLCALEHVDGMEMWVTRWDSVTVYYIVSAVITLAGLMCFYGIAYHPYGKRVFRHKDEELAALDASGFISTKMETAAINTSKKPLFRSSDSKGLMSETHMVEVDPELSAKRVVAHIWREALAQSLVTIVSTIVASLYIDFPMTHFMDLPTILVYNYYICASAGTFLTSWTSFRRLFTPTRLLVLAILRIGFLPLALLYKANVITHHDDYMVIVLNSVHMFIGGVVFSLSFSMSANKFRSKPARSAASTFMNIFYYVAMAIGMAISFPLSR